VRRADLIVLLGLVAIAALLRMPGLNVRGSWDADQGHDMSLDEVVERQRSISGEP